MELRARYHSKCLSATVAAAPTTAQSVSDHLTVLEAAPDAATAALAVSLRRKVEAELDKIEKMRKQLDAAAVESEEREAVISELQSWLGDRQEHSDQLTAVVQQQHSARIESMRLRIVHRLRSGAMHKCFGSWVDWIGQIVRLKTILGRLGLTKEKTAVEASFYEWRDRVDTKARLSRLGSTASMALEKLWLRAMWKQLCRNTVGGWLAENQRLQM